ncbi:subtilisin-like protein [Macrolepiota fuliginosa MF-IS2]|uniref:tripeptidyl-peptidase II n=1 Tax=Macrolepiota fuliginosa MF-IS2 TaxID=1400762 RepID=A0A9P5XCN3_9AGAR|nr:subtilisin-like protein [Macrolepiota fuliginosa MF-IS2]
MLWRPVFVFLLAQLVSATPLARRWNDFAEKHAWVEIPDGWEVHSEAPSDYTFDLRIGLKQSKMDELIENLMEISDPAHARYGQHLSKEDAEDFVRPRPESSEAVEAWLGAHGVVEDDVTHRTDGGDWVTVRVSVAQAERMLGTKYNVFHHPKSGEKVVRTMSYSLPRELHSHVDVVAPTTYFGTMRSMRATSFLQPEIKPVEDVVLSNDATVPSSCTNTITPACLRALYNTVNYVPAAASKNGLGIAGYLDEFANRADLQTFFKRFRPDAVGSNFTTIQVNGGGDDQNDPGVEANLDIQYATGISFPTPNTYWSTGGSPPFIPDSLTPTNTNEPYLDWLNFVLSQTSIPPVITTSYGDNEQTVPNDYAVSVCNLLAQLGSRGVTVFFSSGDFGVGGGDCRTNDGTNKVLFQPAFPASCPFVTTVGGTTRVNPEIAVSFSGGGFSRYFATPSYQTTAVTNYINFLGNTFNGLYNKTGRAYPDVSAQGNGFQVVIGGTTSSVGGTSASSPTVAGVFALLNDFRLSQGKSTLGFVNPLLYSTASTGFNDITAGANAGCGTSGFSARAGWDPVTGLGTPDFLKLQQLV